MSTEIHAGAAASALPDRRPPENGFPRRSRFPGESGFRRSLLQSLPVLEVRLALSDFDYIAVRIADVAARLAVLVHRLREKLCAPALPQFVAGLDIRNADVHEAV